MPEQPGGEQAAKPEDTARKLHLIRGEVTKRSFSTVLGDSCIEANPRTTRTQLRARRALLKGNAGIIARLDWDD